MIKNWLITGGCGFIGSSLIARLRKEYPDVNIRVLDNLSVGTEEDLAEVAEFRRLALGQISGKPQGVELIEGDIKDSGTTMQAAKGVDCIVHLAANTGVGPSVENPRIDMETNVGGTFNLLEAARKERVEKFVFASSGAPVGEVTPPIHEELAPHPVSPYGASKLAGEGYCSAYFRTFGVKTVALRFGNVYGPRSKHKSSVVAKFIKLALDGKACEIYGDGSQTRDFIYIDDLTDAILKAVSVDVGGEIYQIATSRERTVNEIAEVIREELASRDVEMKIIYGEKRLGDVMRNYSDTSKALEKLGWSSMVPLDEGVKKTITYFTRQ